MRSTRIHFRSGDTCRLNVWGQKKIIVIFVTKGLFTYQLRRVKSCLSALKSYHFGPNYDQLSYTMLNNKGSLGPESCADPQASLRLRLDSAWPALTGLFEERRMAAAAKQDGSVSSPTPGSTGAKDGQTYSLVVPLWLSLPTCPFKSISYWSDTNKPLINQ